MLFIMVLTVPNDDIFKERLKEVLTMKAFNSASVENFRQTKLRIAARIAVETEQNETADVVVIILYVKGKIAMEAVSWQYSSATLLH